MTQLLYIDKQTAITWRDTGGTYAMTLNNLASGAGRQGAEHNFGDPIAAWYEFRAWVEFETTPVLDEIVRIYLKTGDGTIYDNDDGTGDIAVSAEAKLANVQQIGRIVVDEAAANIRMGTSGLIYIVADRVMPIFWNGTADNLQATNNTSGFDLVPVPPQLQNDV